MITEVLIKNISLSDEIEFNLGNGLNVFTGETGAGKSLVISAISFALGFSSEFNRLKKENMPCEVSVTISLNDKLKSELQEILKESSIEFDDELIITRIINNDFKTKNSINGFKVPVNLINKIGKILIEISGQNEELMLLDTKVQLELFDKYISNEMLDLKAKLSNLYYEIKKLLNEKQLLEETAIERNRKIDLYLYQINEIKNANLYINEDVELANEIEFLKNIEKIVQIKNEIKEILDGENSNYSLITSFSKLLKLFSKLSQYDQSFENITNSLNDAYYLLEEASNNISKLDDRLNYSEEDLNLKIERLQLISQLKRKYGNEISDILNYLNFCENELKLLENFEQNYEEINIKINEKFNEYLEIANQISNIRHKVKDKIETEINNELHSLDMKNASFKVEIKKIENFNVNLVNLNGLETIEFYIRTNPGTPYGPISKIASGGEMSRIMLAIKNVLSNYSNVPTIIFDEIDTGIGGFTLNNVGLKLRSIANNKQVICVTHSPIIASFANNHYLVKKEIIDNEKTNIKILKLSNLEIEKEIARMLGNDSEIGISHAKELISKNKPN